MASSWTWIVICGLILLGIMVLWNDYYSYTGICRDSYGIPYSCQKAQYNYRNIGFTSYHYDSYGNRVVVRRNGYNFDDYYDCYHAQYAPDDRYGEYLIENYRLNCNGFNANENIQTSSSSSSSEKPPIIYVR